MAPTFAKIYPRNNKKSYEWLGRLESCHREYIQEVKSDLSSIAYQLSISNAKVRGDRVGWKMGQTSDVDLLTGEVDEAATAHARWDFDLGSGMLNLYGTDEEHPVWFFDEGKSLWMSLGKGQSHCFLKRTTLFKLNGSQYTLVCEDLDKQAISCHDQALDHMCRQLNLIPPHPRIFRVPKPDPHIIRHDIVGSGAFGTVFAGIDVSTQKVVAIKEIDIRRKTDYEALTNEIQVATSFPVGPLT